MWTKPTSSDIKMDAEIGSYQGEGNDWPEVIKPAVEPPQSEASPTDAAAP